MNRLRREGAGLAGKRAVVTGGCSGIGLATVRRLIADGASVLVADRDVEGGRRLVDECGERLIFEPCDVAVEAQVAHVIREADHRLGGLDILFNNAGLGGAGGTVEAVSEIEWNATFAVLLNGPLFGIKYAAPVMRRGGGGAIINTASIAGRESGWGPLAYSVAKAALLHLTTLTAADLGRSNIRVNAVVPGLIATAIFGADGVPGEAARLQARVSAMAQDVQPVPRAGSADDVAEIVAFLGSDRARFISGAQVAVDGALATGQRHAWDARVLSPVRQILDGI